MTTFFTHLLFLFGTVTASATKMKLNGDFLKRIPQRTALVMSGDEPSRVLLGDESDTEGDSAMSTVVESPSQHRAKMEFLQSKAEEPELESGASEGAEALTTTDSQSLSTIDDGELRDGTESLKPLEFTEIMARVRSKATDRQTQNLSLSTIYPVGMANGEESPNKFASVAERKNVMHDNMEQGFGHDAAPVPRHAIEQSFENSVRALVPQGFAAKEGGYSTFQDSHDITRSGLGDDSSDVSDPKGSSAFVLNKLAKQVIRGEQEGNPYGVADAQALLRKFQDAGYKNPQELDQKVILNLEKTPKSNPTEVYEQPWQARWRTIKRLGRGGYGEAWLVQNLQDTGLAVMKRVPIKEQGRYITWSDQGRLGAEYDFAIDSLRDECAWSYYLQKFGIDFHYASRFLFMQCLETNVAPRSETQFPEKRPGDKHELYVMVSFAGEPLDKLTQRLTNGRQVANILQELVTGLHYMELAGIIHHDLKADNIMYREVVDLNGSGRTLALSHGSSDAGSGSESGLSAASTAASASPEPATSGHIVMIDFGAMLDVDCNTKTFMDAAYTPGFNPPEHERIGTSSGGNPKTSYDVFNPKTSYDVFSMAGVISQVILGGENLVQRYIVMVNPGRPQAGYRTNWNAFKQLVESDAETFQREIQSLADTIVIGHRRTKDHGLVKVTRGDILREITGRFPDFMENWRKMWSLNGPRRQEGSEAMWQMFLHGDMSKRGAKGVTMAGHGRNRAGK